jgi:glucokinase
MTCVIGIDLGGTNLRGALVNKKGEILARHRIPTEAMKGRDHVLTSLYRMVTHLQDEAVSKKVKVVGLGAGVPGIIDQGVVYQSPHFADWRDFDIQSALASQISLPIVVDNDANFVACGEAWLGAAQKLDHFICLTLGTGIGGSVFINGQLWHGDSGFAGEMGHLVIEAFGPPCACGSKGCWELYCSATGLKRLMEVSEDEQGREAFEQWLKKGLHKATIDDLHKAAVEGDIFANTMFKKFGYYLGIGISSLVNAMDIETFVVGGGVSQAWDFFIEEAKDSFVKRTYDETSRRVKLVQAQLGDDGGVLGAASAAFLI